MLQVPEDLRLEHGAHTSPDEGMCMLEAAAHLAGEPFSDAPACVCPTIAVFGRAWNDALDAEDRNRLLLPLLPVIVGTNTGERDSVRRAWMALDWLARVHTPAFLDLVPRLQGHASSLRSLPAITEPDSHAMGELRAARAAARVAARDAARYAAVVAARDAARDAAWDAAWAAARAAARDAAWDAAGDVAWDAARAAAVVAAGDAVRDAAGDAARAALRPTVETLQESAADLVHRMCAVGKVG